MSPPAPAGPVSFSSDGWPPTFAEAAIIGEAVAMVPVVFDSCCGVHRFILTDSYSLGESRRVRSESDDVVVERTVLDRGYKVQLWRPEHDSLSCVLR